MSRNGSGTYSLPAGNPVVTGTTIDSTVHNNTLSDIATALTQSLAKDGQTTPTANLPMGGYKHTGVATATATTEYARADQVQNASMQYLSSVTGTDTITASATPTPAAYAAGQSFRFVSAGANTGAVTLNVSSLGAKSVTKQGSTALVAGDIPNGAIVEVVYDGTQFQLISLRYQTYDANTAKLNATQSWSNVQTFGNSVRGTATALTSTSNSIAVDLAAGNFFTHTFTENTTIANPSNIVAGQEGIIVWTQHASSPKTLAFGSYYKFPGGTVPTMTATNSAVDVMAYYVVSSTFIACKFLQDVK